MTVILKPKVIRRFLIKALKGRVIERSLEEYEADKITLWKAASKSGISLWEMRLKQFLEDVCISL